MMERGSSLRFRDCCPLLLVEVEGIFREADIPQMAQEISDACERGRYQAVLVDARAQTATVYGPTEYVLLRYRIATAISKHWFFPIPLAIVVSEERFTPDYLLQTVCSFHGVRACGFTEMSKAKAWLGSFVPVLHPSLSLRGGPNRSF